MRVNFIKVWGTVMCAIPSRLFYPLQTGMVDEKLYAICDRDINLFVYSDREIFSTMEEARVLIKPVAERI